MTPSATSCPPEPDARPSPPRQRPVRVAPWISLLLIGLAGCSEELGPEQFKTTSIKGRVISVSGPVRSGWIELIPTEGTIGNLVTARIGPDGTFQFPKAPIGRVGVALVKIPTENLPTPLGTVPTTIFSVGSSPIRRTIPDTPNANIDIDLVIEAVVYTREREALQKIRSGNAG